MNEIPPPERERRIPPRAYWMLFRLSPLLQVLGMGAGGWLILSSILVWGVGGYPVTPDLPIAAVLVALWAVGVAMLLLPPAAIRATVEVPTGDAVGGGRALVWALGRRFRFWNLIAAPVAGVLAIMLPFAVVTGFGGAPGVTPNLPVGIPVSLALVALSVPLLWVVLRAGLLGVELTDTQLVSRGYLRTRRYDRSEVVDARIGALDPLVEFGVSTVMNRRVETSLQIRMRNGRVHILPSANSTGRDLVDGAAIIRVWCGASSPDEVTLESPRRRSRR